MYFGIEKKAYLENLAKSKYLANQRKLEQELIHMLQTKQYLSLNIDLISSCLTSVSKIILFFLKRKNLSSDESEIFDNLLEILPIIEV